MPEAGIALISNDTAFRHHIFRTRHDVVPPYIDESRPIECHRSPHLHGLFFHKGIDCGDVLRCNFAKFHAVPFRF